MKKVRLLIEGILDQRILKAYDVHRLFDPYIDDPGYLIVLCLYAEQDIALGQEFNYITYDNNRECLTFTTKLIMSTEWGFKLDYLPSGHKTVSVMKVLGEGIPVGVLPIVGDYGKDKGEIWFSTHAFDSSFSE